MGDWEFEFDRNELEVEIGIVVLKVEEGVVTSAVHSRREVDCRRTRVSERKSSQKIEGRKACQRRG